MMGTWKWDATWVCCFPQAIGNYSGFGISFGSWFPGIGHSYCQSMSEPGRLPKKSVCKRSILHPQKHPSW